MTCCRIWKLSIIEQKTFRFLPISLEHNVYFPYCQKHLDKTIKRLSFFSYKYILKERNKFYNVERKLRHVWCDFLDFLDSQPNMETCQINMKLYHIIRLLAWVIIYEIEWLSSKMRKLQGCENLEKYFFEIVKIDQSYSRNVGRGNFKMLPFSTRCTHLAHLFSPSRDHVTPFVCSSTRLSVLFLKHFGIPIYLLMVLSCSSYAIPLKLETWQWKFWIKVLSLCLKSHM